MKIAIGKSEYDVPGQGTLVYYVKTIEVYKNCPECGEMRKVPSKATIVGRYVLGYDITYLETASILLTLSDQPGRNCCEDTVKSTAIFLTKEEAEKEMAELKPKI